MEIDDDATAFGQRLRAAGLTVDVSRDGLRVALHDDAVYDVIRDVAAELETPLARLELLAEQSGEISFALPIRRTR